MGMMEGRKGRIKEKDEGDVRERWKKGRKRVMSIKFASAAFILL